VNVLTKIISSPFNAVASLVGSEEDISKITFLPGESLLDDKQKEKLDSLATALADRPALKLEIRGAAFSKQDWPHLQVEALDKKLLKMRAEELSKKTKKAVLPEHLKYSKEENQRLLADLYIKKFPTKADRSLFGTPRLIDSEDDFYEVAQHKMASLIKPNTQRLEKLAVARAQAIAKYLSTKELASDRVFLLNVVIDPKDAENLIASSLNLTVN
ncbi:MAG: membrane biogenesis protein, partial [Methylococcaceae bacterium]|nr:membrane biogenesis protein [Methylococcaceae bacterium]